MAYDNEVAMKAVQGIDTLEQVRRLCLERLERLEMILQEYAEKQENFAHRQAAAQDERERIHTILKVMEKGQNTGAGRSGLAEY